MCRFEIFEDLVRFDDLRFGRLSSVFLHVETDSNYCEFSVFLLVIPRFHLKIESFDLLKLRRLEIVGVVADNFIKDTDDEVAFSLVASEEDEVVNP